MNEEILKDERKTFISFIKLVEMMRETQKKYFAARKRHDEISAKQYLVKSFALEKRVDDACKQCRELILTNFQPELFK